MKTKKCEEDEKAIMTEELGREKKRYRQTKYSKIPSSFRRNERAPFILASIRREASRRQ